MARPVLEGRGREESLVLHVLLSASQSQRGPPAPIHAGGVSECHQGSAWVSRHAETENSPWLPPMLGK